MSKKIKIDLSYYEELVAMATMLDSIGRVVSSDGASVEAVKAIIGSSANTKDGE